MTGDKEKAEFNSKQLNDIEKLEYNWNDNGAPAFKKEMIDEMRRLLAILPVQPYVFPTARPSIQFEYEKENDDYLEFEVLEDLSIKMYMSLCNGSKEHECSVDEEQVIQKIKIFYGIGDTE